MVFERLAKWLQATTRHRYAWFGELWSYFLLVQVIELLVVVVALPFIARQIIFGNLLEGIFLSVAVSVGALTILAILLDEKLAAIELGVSTEAQDMKLATH